MEIMEELENFYFVCFFLFLIFYYFKFEFIKYFRKTFRLNLRQLIF